MPVVEVAAGTSAELDRTGQDEALSRVLNADGKIEARDQAAAILVLVFGQQAERIAQLTREDVTVAEELVTVQLGSINIALPNPLDEPWRVLAENPIHGLTAAHPNSNWVFTGHFPGKHIRPGHLTERLTRIFSTCAARLGTLHELTRLAPVAIIAETLGYSPTTIERHATGSPVAYAQYIAATKAIRRSPWRRDQ